MFGILLNYVYIWKEFIKNIVVFILVFILGYYLKNERKFKKNKENYNDTVIYLDNVNRVYKCKDILKKLKEYVDLEDEIDSIKDYLNNLTYESVKKLSYFEHLFVEIIISYLEKIEQKLNEDVDKNILREDIYNLNSIISKFQKIYF